MNTLALIGLGSNLGDRGAILDAAIDALRGTSGVRVLEASRFWETVAVGGPSGQDRFRNGALVLETGLGPSDLLGELQRIEGALGRVRQVRWGPRTLDLDLLFFGDARIGRDSVPAWPSIPLAPNPEPLIVPHPRAAFRRFVLGPLVEIAPEFVDPSSGRTIGELLQWLDRRPSRLGFVGDWSDREGRAIVERLALALDANDPDRWRLGLDGATLVVDRREWDRTREVAPGFDALAEVLAICRGTRG